MSEIPVAGPGSHSPWDDVYMGFHTHPCPYHHLETGDQEDYTLHHLGPGGQGSVDWSLSPDIGPSPNRCGMPGGGGCFPRKARPWPPASTLSVYRDCYKSMETSLWGGRTCNRSNTPRPSSCIVPQQSSPPHSAIQHF